VARGPRIFLSWFPVRRSHDENRRDRAGARVVIDFSDSLSFDLKAVLYSALLDG
jgi:hypothetical protein